MSYYGEHFNLDQTVALISQAISAIVCHIGFDAGLHGLALACLVGLIGLVLSIRKQRFGRPLIAVCGKLSLFCAVLMLPGAVMLLLTHQLPSTGTFQISSLGFIVFWSLISLHLSAEEMNFQWF